MIADLTRVFLSKLGFAKLCVISKENTHYLRIIRTYLNFDKKSIGWVKGKRGDERVHLYSDGKTDAYLTTWEEYLTGNEKKISQVQLRLDRE